MLSSSARLLLFSATKDLIDPTTGKLAALQVRNLGELLFVQLPQALTIELEPHVLLQICENTDGYVTAPFDPGALHNVFRGGNATVPLDSVEERIPHRDPANFESTQQGRPAKLCIIVGFHVPVL